MYASVSWHFVLVILVLHSDSTSALRRSNFAVQPHPIQFNEEPEDWTVSVGSSVSLTCNTSVVQIVGYLDEERTPSPQIEWIHNNVTISSGGHYTINNSTMGTSILTITNVTLVEQGDYHCLVNDWKNEDGGWWTSTRSRSGHIKALVVSSDSVTVYEHDNIILSCMGPTLSVPSDGVVWMKDGVMISEQVTDVKDNLMLMGVSKDHDGHYQCYDHVGNLLSSCHVVVNSTKIYEEILLNMDYVDDQFVRITSNQFGCPTEVDNQSVPLHCNATGYQEMIWYKNGQLLDVNSTDIVFNQTTSSWTITKNNPCDLLGVYQCFVINEVGTVHVSTRVLPLGWPNHPGRPELLAHSSFSNGFSIVIKLHPPDYMGGITEEQWRYDVYLADSGLNFDGDFLDTAIPSNPIINITLEKNVQIFVGVGSLLNTYYVTTQLALQYNPTLSLADINALPTGSPFLLLRTFCELIDYPPPIVEETCHYNDTGDFVTHNVSWRVEGSVVNYVFADNIVYWLLSGGCHYPNGSVAAITGSLTYGNYWSHQLPVNTTCNISISYPIVCVSKPYPTSFNVPCNYTTNDFPTIVNHPPNGSEDHRCVSCVFVVFGTIIGVALVTIVLCLVLLLLLLSKWRKVNSSDKHVEYTTMNQ